MSATIGWEYFESLRSGDGYTLSGFVTTHGGVHDKNVHPSVRYPQRGCVFVLVDIMKVGLTNNASCLQSFHEVDFWMDVGSHFIERLAIAMPLLRVQSTTHCN